MKVFTYSEARQNLARLLTLAQSEEVQIRRKEGCVFTLGAKQPERMSPVDVTGVKTKVSTDDILEAVRESRSQ